MKTTANGSVNSILMRALTKRVKSNETRRSLYVDLNCTVPTGTGGFQSGNIHILYYSSYFSKAGTVLIYYTYVYSHYNNRTHIY